MAEYGRAGHRARIRKTYLVSGADGMPDVNLLELFLSLVIPQKDVKPMAYDLLNKFGSLEKVFSADIKELTSVKGIGENTAMAISIYKDFIFNAKNANSKSMLDLEYRKEFSQQVIKAPKKFAIYALNSEGHLITSFYYNSINEYTAFDIIKDISNINCGYILIARRGIAEILKEDVDAITEIKLKLQTMGVYILDYITVGINDVLAVSETEKRNLVLY